MDEGEGEGLALDSGLLFGRRFRGGGGGEGGSEVRGLDDFAEGNSCHCILRLKQLLI